MATTKRARTTGAPPYLTDEWETGPEPSVAHGQQSGRPQRSSAQREILSERAPTSTRSASSDSAHAPSSSAGQNKRGESERMGGLALPDVVRELLRDPGVLKWHPREQVYEVMHGDNFEKRFNDLRKVRNKPKAAGTERPFSRMYNFYVLEQGDKWAKTGTRFKPRNASGFPRPEIVTKSAESKKERVSKSPSVAPQKAPVATGVLRSQEAMMMKGPMARVHENTNKSHSQAASKMTPHAIRPMTGRNPHILGNRASPPPPSVTSERARLDAMLNDRDDEMVRMHRLAGKRPRDYEDDRMDLGLPQPLDLPSARRLRTMEASSHAGYLGGPAPGPYYAAHSHSHYHHESLQHRTAAASLSKDEQAYLYRMRPEVREEVMRPLYMGRRSPLYPGTMHQYMHQEAAVRRMEMMHSMHHRESHMSSTVTTTYHAMHHHRMHEPHDDYVEHDEEEFQEHHQHQQWPCERLCHHHHPSVLPSRQMATMRALNEAPPTPVAVAPKFQAETDADEENKTDSADGFSSCWSTPDTVVAICEDFVGSPLDLGESECLATLLDSPAAANSTPRKGCGALIFHDDDEIDDTPWGIEDLACGTSW